MTDNEQFDFEWETAATDDETPDEEGTGSNHGPAHDDPTELRSNGTEYDEASTEYTGADTTTSMFDSVFDGNGGGDGELTTTDVNRVRSILEEGDVDAVETADGAADPLALGRVGEDVPDWFLPGGVGESVTDLLFSGQSDPDSTDVPEVARVLAEATWRMSDYSLRAQMRTSTRITNAVAASESPDELLTKLFDIAEDELENAEAELRRQGIEPPDATQISERSSDDWSTERASETDAPTTEPTPDWNPDAERGTPAGRPTTETESDRERTPDERSAPEGVVDSLPDLSATWMREVVSDAPLVLGAVRQAAEYSAQAQNRAVRRLWRTATAADSPDELLSETRDIAIEEGQRLGLDLEQDLANRVAGRRGATSADAEAAEQLLSERGSQVMRRSADTDYEEPVHPAYAHILEQVALDEARILRLLATDGRQPAVDVRSKGLLLGSELIAENLSMIGIEAGCHEPDRTPIYLGNLERLGLVRISDEPLDNLKRYQMLEAQPDVAEAEEEARRASIAYKSIRLTPLGTDFCQLCLSVDVDTEQTVAEIPDDEES